MHLDLKEQCNDCEIMHKQENVVSFTMTVGNNIVRETREIKVMCDCIDRIHSFHRKHETTTYYLCDKHHKEYLKNKNDSYYK